ncbi:bifunctional acetate--CoA ligase family protein/GNAT family N-acetyltransferase [Thermodesulforhabdus norvegica]|uniref:Acetyltransferase n=1 Tax=Thermodesulforhabdus norvegica TaxID=39841 RepID=A0A1I4SIB9_9BACT|nr:bifunctional acetate--CoA ligase family protein/GNAT family N-acetyltransferase [Thermodesulforhabdus norvegica]SFM64154.1 acetyltransferase [Thermodesulforhabdus norvegica]
MGIYGLDRIFDPESIAVIGASNNRGSVGWAVMKNLVEGGFPGPVFPINPKYDRVWDRQCFKSISEIDQKIDLVVVAVPIASVPEVIRECGERGVGGAVILSAGGRETGPEGRKLEEKILAEARKHRVRIIGPNCLGIIVPHAKLNASFAAATPLPGRMAFISQSGAICTAVLDLALAEGFGFSHFVSIGSMADVDFADLIDYLGNTPRVTSILLYVESIPNMRKFMSASRSVSRLKPIIVLKAGKSPAGARAAASHTGAMAGEDILYDAAFWRAGVLRVRTIGELFDCAELLGKQPRPRGSGLAIITNAGGPGVMAADALADMGFEPVRLEPETLQKLNEILPPQWSHNNPIDILGDASPERYLATLQTCLRAPEVDGVLVILTPQAMTDPTAVAEIIAREVKHSAKPVLAVWMGGQNVQMGRDILNRANIPTYETPERAIESFLYLYRQQVQLKVIQQIPPKLNRALSFDRKRAEELVKGSVNESNGVMGEVEAKELLSAYGIPVNRTVLARSADEARHIAVQLGFPVVMKIASPDILHKTEAKGVRVDVRSPEEVVRLFEEIVASAKSWNPSARIEGVSIQRMIKKAECEVLVGAKHDPLFGPAVLFGMGGIYTEVIRDRAVTFPPLNRSLARELMEKTKVFRILSGFRNLPPADIEALEEMLIRFSQLLIDFPEISEVDMNPVFIVGGKPVVVDARVILQPASVTSPHHLIISPYPEEWETRGTTSGGIDIFIRPIRPEDAPLLVELFHVLSPTSIYYRFFRPLKELSEDMLVRFTQVDYDREIALVALDASSADERMLGVARVISDPDGRRAEFSILVGDPWQGRGVGAMLLSRCLVIAKKRGIKEVWGTVLRENRGMLALAKKLGFTTKFSKDLGECEVIIDLHKTHLPAEEYFRD